MAVQNKNENQNNNHKTNNKSMKKFYALSAALLATGSMLAVNPAALIKPEARVAGESAVMSAEGQAMFRAEQAYNQYVGDNNIEMPGSMKYTWTDNQGVKWDVTMMEDGQWSDNFTSWADAALYAKVRCNLRNQATSNSDLKIINYVMFFPRYALWKESGWSQLFPGEEAAADKILPLKYCVSTSDIMTTNWPKGWCVPQLSTDPNNFYIGQTSTTGGDKADALVIMNSNTKTSSGGHYFDGGSLGYARYNGVACGPRQGSSFQMSNFDEETSSIDMAFNGSCTNASGQMVWTYTYNYSGYAFLPGLTKTPVEWAATNVHIVNTGSIQGSDEAYYNFDDRNWGPFQRFYVLACGEGYTYDNVELQGGGMLWSSTKIPEGPARMEANAISTNLRSALFSPNGATEPNNVWYEAPIEVSIDQYQDGHTDGVPGVNSFLYGGWNDDYWSWSATDGMKTSYRGTWFYAHAVKNPGNGTYNPFVMNGTTEGFGYKGKTTFNCDYTVKFKGNIVYHYDPTDYLKTREIPSVGTITTPSAWFNGVSTIFAENDNNVNVNAANGMINVTVENAAMVNIYNMAGMIVKSVNAKAGQTVSVDVANGIYVVKVGNKAVKVAL